MPIFVLEGAAYYSLQVAFHLVFYAIKTHLPLQCFNMQALTLDKRIGICLGVRLVYFRL